MWNECKKDCAASGWCSAANHGATCTTYSSSSVWCWSSCTSRSSTCNNGSWSTTPYSYSSCSRSCYCAASGWCSRSAEWTTCTTYSSSSVTCPSSCTSRSSTCQSNGSWSTTPYSYSSCSRWGTCTYSLTSCPDNWNCSSQSCYTAGSCWPVTRYNLDSCKSGYTKVWNECKKDCAASGWCSATSHWWTCTSYSVQTTPASSVPCSSYKTTSTCNNGTWSPSPSSYSTCSVPVSNCPATSQCSSTAPWWTCVTYLSSSVSNWSSCTKRTSTCQSNWKWDLTPYNYKECHVWCWASHWCPATAHGSTCTRYKNNSGTSKSQCENTYRKDAKCSDSNWNMEPGDYSYCQVCFPAGTNIIMADGSYKNIENIQTWDIVLSYNIETQKFEPNKVLYPIIHEDSSHEMYELTINWNILKVTNAHRFYVVYMEDEDYKCNITYDWVVASDLKVWDNLFMDKQKYGIIENIKHYPNKETVYNMSVDNNHNYFVDEWYLVHNAKPAWVSSYNGCYSTYAWCNAVGNGCQYDSSMGLYCR